MKKPSGLAPARPICEAGGHSLRLKSTNEQVGSAWGLPITPVGRCVVADLMSLTESAQLRVVRLVDPILITTSGWPPACVVLGTTEKLLISSAAEAEAARATVATVATASAQAVLARALRDRRVIGSSSPCRS